MRVRSRSLLLTAALGAAALAPAAAQGAQATVTRSVIAGPSDAISTLKVPGNDQIDVDAAPDGTAAIAYRQIDAGQPHVFVSELKADGTWTAGTRVDTGLADPSLKPTLAVGNGGHVVVLFPNGPAGNEALFASVQTSAGAAFGNPQQISSSGGVGWSWVEADIAPGGAGYLVGVRGVNLLAQRIDGNTFTPLSGGNPLQADTAQLISGGAQNGPRVAVDATGATGTIAWPEPDPNLAGGHIPFARKITGIAVGPAVSLSLDGTKPFGHPGDNSANDDLSVTTGGGTTWVAFHANFDSGGGQLRAHGVVRTFDGTNVGPAQRVDGITDGPAVKADNNAEFPRVAVNASGQGLGATYLGLDPFGAQASVLTNGTWSLGTAITNDPETGAATAFPAMDANGAGQVAFYNTITPTKTQILSRVYGGLADGSVQTLSNPTFGAAGAPIKAVAGNGKAITAFMQSVQAPAYDATTTRIVAAVTDLPVATPTPTPTPNPNACTTGGGACPLQTCPTAGGGSSTCPGLTLKNAFADFKLVSKTITRTSAAPAIVTGSSPKPTITFSLVRAATVKITLQRQTPGRTSKGKCVAETTKNRKAKSCKRLVAVKGSASLKAPAGLIKLAFGGSLTKGKLAATGTYVITLSATEASGATADPVSATFTLKAAPKKSKK